MNGKLKVGLLGCGGIAQIAHLPALKKAENVEFTAICDVAEDLVNLMAKRYEVDAIYTDHRKFLEHADMDAVLLPVAHAFHAPLSIECMRAGKDMLVEKPMAMTVEECEQMLQVSEETGRQLQIGCMKRYDPGLQFAQKFVAEEMGERLSVSGWYCDTVFHGQYVHCLALPLRSSSAQRRPERGGTGDGHLDMILGHGVHAIDTIRFFGGDVVAVTTKVAEKRQGINSTSLFEFADGACGSFQLICTVKMDWFEGITVHGENGSVVAQIGFPYYRKASDVKVFDAKRGEYRTPAVPDADPYERQLEAFAAAILEGREVSPNAKDGLAAQKVMMAVHESAKAGKRVEIV
ncbi:TPA: Gfo/Idh/MocA family oxidoreductase [Candidatus Poribacteria bacterium]|nr:Gfo/Idh/MocA family oxidoreductase [Candidatus Poribacteria bacterium]